MAGGVEGRGECGHQCGGRPHVSSLAFVRGKLRMRRRAVLDGDWGARPLLLVLRQGGDQAVPADDQSGIPGDRAGNRARARGRHIRDERDGTGGAGACVF